MAYPDPSRHLGRSGIGHLHQIPTRPNPIFVGILSPSRYLAHTFSALKIFSVVKFQIVEIFDKNMDLKNFRSSSQIQPQKKASTSVTSKSTQTLSTQTTLPPSSAFKKLTVSAPELQKPLPTKRATFASPPMPTTSPKVDPAKSGPSEELE